ncbi:MAG: hypothetical protein WA981_15560 [Glaciecola sp.]
MNALTPSHQIEPTIPPLNGNTVVELAAFKKLRKQPSIHWAIVSGALHIVVLLIVILIANYQYQTTQESFPANKVTSKPIISYLHLPTTPKNKAPKKDTHTLQIKQIKDTHTLNTAKQSNEPTDNSSDKLLNTEPNDQQSDTKIKAPELSPKTATNAPPVVQQKTLPAASRPTILPTSTLNALNKLHFSKRQSIAADEAKAHNHAQTSPSLTPLEERKDTWQLPQQPANIEVYCDSVASKSAAFISGLTGGSLRCVELPNFQQYIDQRVNSPSSKE